MRVVHYKDKMLLINKNKHPEQMQRLFRLFHSDNANSAFLAAVAQQITMTFIVKQLQQVLSYSHRGKFRLGLTEVRSCSKLLQKRFSVA